MNYPLAEKKPTTTTPSLATYIIRLDKKVPPKIASISFKCLVECLQKISSSPKNRVHHHQEEVTIKNRKLKTFVIY